MAETAAISRPLWARLAVILVHVTLPGMGLLWLGRIRAGLAFLLPSQALLLAFQPPLWLLPTTRGHEQAFALVLVSAAVMGLLLMGWSSLLIWRESHLRTVPSPKAWHWPYWLAWIVLVPFWLLTPELPIKGYHAVSESMAPTLKVEERMWADNRVGQGLRRGDVVTYLGPDGGVWVHRLMALGGDRIALRKGIVILNGKPLRQRLVSVGAGPESVRILSEQMPDGSTHLVTDLGVRPQDDVPEQRVPAGQVFVLGDNRDNSEDSRFDPTMGGPGMIAADDLLGRVFLIYWSRELDKIGRVP